jgi:integrase
MLWLLALALAADAPAPPAQGRVVEEVVAVLRNPTGATPRPITLTKLTEEARIALVGRGAVAAAWQPLDAAALRAALDWLVDQMLVADEAARLRVDDVDRDALGAEVRRFRERFASPGEYARFLAEMELSEEELAVTLARGLRVRRYVESRVGRWARVTDAEVEAYLGSHGAKDASATARDAVRAHLAEEKVTAQVKQLLADLRSRADVRIVSPPGGEER